MKRSSSKLRACIIASALLTAIIATPTVGSAASVGSSFAIKAVNSAQSSIYAIKPLPKSGTSTPTPTATATPTPTPTATYPPASPEVAFNWSVLSDGTARLDSMGAGYGITDVVIPQTATVSGASRKVTAVAASALSGKSITSLVIPDSVSSIGSYAFSDNKLTSIVLPKSLTAVAAGTFYNNAITSVTIPDAVTSIGISSFQKNAISSLTLSKSITTVPTFAFDQNALTSVTIPSSVTSIGANSFSNNKLQTVSIPGTVTAIGDSAFRTNSITSLTLGSGLKTIGDFVFFANANLPDGLVIPSTVTALGNRTLESATLKNIYMAGDAPTTFTTGTTNPSGTFGSPTGKTLYYKSGSTGYTTPTWKGYSTATY